MDKVLNKVHKVHKVMNKCLLPDVFDNLDHPAHLTGLPLFGLTSVTILC